MTDPADRMSVDICVVGAGAAGLWAAAGAARRGRQVLLVEKTPRTGTKILASGGTRCNVTTTLDAGEAARLFGPRGDRFLRPAFRALPPEGVRSHLASLGVPTVTAPLDKVFPASGRATDVRDALERDARQAGAEILCHAAVQAIGTEGDGWVVRLSQGRTITCRQLLLCPGGRSYPRTGTTGDGYPWLSGLGVPIVEPVPALVPLLSPAQWVRELAGVTLSDIAVRLVGPEGRVAGPRRRPVVFTHRGISGPGAMDLSAAISRAATPESGHPSHHLLLDLAPDTTQEELRASLWEHADRAGASPIERWFPSTIPQRVRMRALALAGIARELREAGQLPRPLRQRLIEVVKGLPIPITGTRGWDAAEVTAGGVSLDAIDRRTMRIRNAPGLFAFGEILDTDGPIGGLNFQAAFATAELAAREATRVP